jgi:hypothetical protein
MCREEMDGMGWEGDGWDGEQVGHGGDGEDREMGQMGRRWVG